ncbi:MAG: hypothetical protein ACRC7P_01405, partial [Enterovibrio sp.]
DCSSISAAGAISFVCKECGELRTAATGKLGSLSLDVACLVSVPLAAAWGELTGSIIKFRQ